MKRIVFTIAAAGAAVFFISCGTTGTLIETNNSNADKYKGSAEAKASETATEQPQAENAGETPTAVANNRTGDKDVIAVVGDFTLTKKKYRQIKDYMKEKYDYTLTQEQEKEFLDYIINKELMAMEARSLGYDKRSDLQEKYDWDLDEIISHAYYKENVADKSHVTDKEAQDYYNAHTGDFTEIKAQHILVKSRDLADSLYQRLKEGEDFTELAKKYSEDATTKGSGGDLGFFGKGQMVAEFENAAFELSPGDVSEPVRTVYGYHIIKMNDKRKISYDDSKDKIKKIIEERKKKEAFDSLIKNLKNKYKVKVSEVNIGN